MTRAIRIFVAAVGLVALTATSALAAATIHNLNVTFSGDTVTATADVSGLGSQKPAYAILEVEGFASYTNNGGTAAPGQNPVPVTDESEPSPLGNTERNGRGTVNVSQTLTAPATVPAKQAGCPSRQWTASLNDVVVTGATLTITQGNQVVFSQYFDNPDN